MQICGMCYSSDLTVSVLSLLALEPPRYKHGPTNQTVNVSESLLMKCDVEGTPTPQLSWLKDNQPLHPMSGESLQQRNDPPQDYF